MKNEAATILNVRVAGFALRAAFLRTAILSDLTANLFTAPRLPAFDIASRRPMVARWKQRSYADSVQTARVTGDTRCGTGDTDLCHGRAALTPMKEGVCSLGYHVAYFQP